MVRLVPLRTRGHSLPMRSSASERLIFRLALAAPLMCGCGTKSQSAGDTTSVSASGSTTASQTAAAQAAREPPSASASTASRVFRERATHPPAPSNQQAVRLDDDNELQNALDDAGRVIVANGSKCHVEIPPEGPDPNPPATSKDELARRPPRPTVLQPVDCPPDYDDAAWDNCSESMYRYLRRAAHGCVCDGGMLGNGPPMRPVPCPKLERKETNSARRHQ
jgi:hypothetical protein